MTFSMSSQLTLNSIPSGGPEYHDSPSSEYAEMPSPSPSSEDSDYLPSPTSTPSPSMAPDSPASLDESKTPSKKRGRRRTRPIDPDHIPRPPNCFIQFRRMWVKQQLAILSATSSKEPLGSAKSLSKLAGEAWARLSAEERSKYQLMAVVAKEDHMEKHPEYKFRPKRKPGIVRRSTMVRSKTLPNVPTSAKFRKQDDPDWVPSIFRQPATTKLSYATDESDVESYYSAPSPPPSVMANVEPHRPTPIYPPPQARVAPLQFHDQPTPTMGEFLKTPTQLGDVMLRAQQQQQQSSQVYFIPPSNSSSSSLAHYNRGIEDTPSPIPSSSTMPYSYSHPFEHIYRSTPSTPSFSSPSPCPSISSTSSLSALQSYQDGIGRCINPSALQTNLTGSDGAFDFFGDLPTFDQASEIWSQHNVVADGYSSFPYATDTVSPIDLISPFVADASSNVTINKESSLTPPTQQSTPTGPQAMPELPFASYTGSDSMEMDGYFF